MVDSTPPTSSKPDSTAWPAGALGALRDGLAVLRNFDQLLRSIRVGPKALTKVIPDVHTSCGGLRSATRTILDEIELALPEGSGTIGFLWRFMSPRVDELEQELAQAVHRQMNAKHRLALQRSVVGLAADLDTARALIDLLANSAWGSRVWLNIDELIHQSAQAVEPGLQRLPPVLATLVGPPQATELLVNTHAALALVALVVSKVASLGQQVHPNIVIEADRNACRIRVDASPSLGREVLVARRRIVGPTMACVSLAANALGARIEYAEDVTTVGLVSPHVRAGTS